MKKLNAIILGELRSTSISLRMTLQKDTDSIYNSHLSDSGLLTIVINLHPPEELRILKLQALTNAYTHAHIYNAQSAGLQLTFEAGKLFIASDQPLAAVMQDVLYPANASNALSQPL